MRSDVSERSVRETLRVVLESEEFAGSRRLSAFLRYVVEETLAGRGAELSEYLVATEALGRGEDFDSRTDTIVRVQARRLRQRLDEYFATHAGQTAIRIEIPKGSYEPRFLPHSALAHKEPVFGSALSPRLRWSLLLGSIVLAAVWWTTPDIESVSIAYSGPLTPLKERRLANSRAAERGPAISPDGTLVAYSISHGPTPTQSNPFLAPSQIYVRRIDDPVEPTQMTFGDSLDTSPAWSPNQDQIAFLRSPRFRSAEAEIMVMSADGGVPRAVGMTNGLAAIGDAQRELAWSPDGEWLAVPNRVGSSGPVRIMLLAVASREVRWLTDPAKGVVGDTTPSFAADGSRRLVFTRRFGWGAGHEVCIVAFDRNYYPVDEVRCLTNFRRVATSPVWVPGSEEILFHGSPDQGREGLWAVPASGKQQPRQLHANKHLDSLSVARTHEGRIRIVYAARQGDIDIWQARLGEAEETSPAALVSTSTVEAQPTFSPDGERIAFVSEGDVWVSREDGSDRRRLTNLRAAITGYADWSPDGTRIAFSSRPQGQSDLYVVNASGGNPRRVTSSDADDVQPRWSADGQWLYFPSNRSGQFDIWRIRADGTQATRVTHMWAREPELDPSGTWLFFQTIRDELPRAVRLDARFPVSEAKVLTEERTRARFVSRGSHLYYQTHDGSVWRHDIGSGVRETVVKLDGIWPAISPDEQTIVYARRMIAEADLFLLEPVE